MASYLYFITLGFSNARRNLGRSVLAVIGMAVAAAALSSSLSLGSGHAAGAVVGQRIFLGGEVLVLPFNYTLGLRDDLRTGRYERVPADFPGDAAAFFPEVYTTGLLLTNGSETHGIDPERVGQASGSTGIPDAGTIALYHHYFIPAIEAPVLTTNAQGLTSPPPEAGWRPPVALRSRDIAIDFLRSFEALIVSGRSFRPADSGQLVCLLDLHRNTLQDRLLSADAETGPEPVTDPWLVPVTRPCRQAPPGWTSARSYPVGSRVSILVPRPIAGPDGRLAGFDYSSLTRFVLEVVGVYELPTENLLWTTDTGAGSEQLYWAGSDILVPEETLLNIFVAAGGRPEWLRPAEVAVGLPNASRADDYAAALRTLLPDLEITTVASLIAAGRDRGLPEPVRTAPVLEPGSRLPGWNLERRVQPGRPAEAGGVIVALVYLIASLILATNMIVLLTSRRQELGIIRALGARAGEVIACVMAETVILALLGGALGFALTRGAATYILLSNDVPLFTVAGLTVIDFLKVLGATTGAALVFGYLAGRSTLTLTPMEVLSRS